MTEQQWREQQDRLNAAFGKKFDEDQCDAFFGVMGEFGNASADFAVTKWIAESRTYPKPADLVTLCYVHRRENQAPAAMCDVCQGTKFTITFCDGKRHGGERGDDERPLVPINPAAAYVCNRDFEHRSHEDAHPCWQCHPLGIKKRAEQAAGARS